MKNNEVETETEISETETETPAPQKKKARMPVSAYERMVLGYNKGGNRAKDGYLSAKVWI